MANYRRGRINDEMQKEVAQILREVKDPRVSGAFVSVIAAEVTPDLKYAKIFFSAFDGDVKETMKGLKSASGFIRSQLARRLNLRATPELTFVHDNSVSHGAEIAAILSTLDIPDDEQTESEDGDV